MPWIKVNDEEPKPATFEDLGYVQVVRCKDCKHFHDLKCSYPERGTCDLWNMLHWGEWFCADGERKDDDA